MFRTFQVIILLAALLPTPHVIAARSGAATYQTSSISGHIDWAPEAVNDVRKPAFPTVKHYCQPYKHVLHRKGYVQDAGDGSITEALAATWFRHHQRRPPPVKESHPSTEQMRVGRRYARVQQGWHNSESVMWRREALR